MIHSVERFRKSALLLAVAAIVCSCASMKERGNEAMEKGAFEEALRYYDTAVKRDPNDVEAANGLRRAREEVVGAKLIQVRSSRMGGNSAGALDLLLEAVNRENEWKFFPGGKVAFTQQEETEFATKYMTQVVSAETQAHRPLKGEILLRKYRPIFPPKDWNAWSASVNRAGKEQCRTLGREVIPGRPYYTRWVSSYCQFWGETAPKPKKATSDSISDTLYGDMELSFSDSNLSPELKAKVAELMNQSLSKTPWYDAQGKRKAVAKVVGGFTSNHTKNGTILEQTYYQDEQYVENVQVEKERLVSYTDYEQIVDPVTHAVSTRSVMRQRPEKYWTTEPQAKTRSVQKSFRYPAWKHQQELSITLALDSKLESKSFQLAHSQRSSAEGIEHDENRPEMKLAPSRPNLPDPQQWATNEIQVLAEKFRTEASRFWRESFCDVDPNAKSVADSGNRMAQCLRGTGGDIPTFAEEWYQANLGVGAREAMGLLKL